MSRWRDAPDRTRQKRGDTVKRLWPIAAALVLVAGLATFVVITKQRAGNPTPSAPLDPGTFSSARPCSHPPRFLRRMHIAQPVMIDLSQKRYTGVALRYGPNFSKVLHPKQWEQYAHFSTYTLDRDGNIYLIPTPYISIYPTTFTLQTKLFRLDTTTGKVGIFMDFDDVHPSAGNPYGLSAATYDCDDHTLWIAAIDESDYRHQRGVIYHIDPRRKTILQRVEGFDALTLRLFHTNKGKFLLAGSARDNGLYAFAIDSKHGLSSRPQKLFALPDPNAHIRKIRVEGRNRLALQAISFSYSLVAQSAKEDRIHFLAKWSPGQQKWDVQKVSR